MIPRLISIAVLSLAVARAELPSTEADIIAHLEGKGAKFKLDGDGEPVRLQHGGKPALDAAEYALIGKLESLEQIALNGAPLVDGEWAWLKELPKLRSLTIWHAGKFASLSNFSELPLESLTVGGCVGVTRLPQTVEGKRDGILELEGLPELRKLSLYHSPLAPDDAHLAHVVESFPKLEDLRLDFKAPRGVEGEITPEGLAGLAELSLKVLWIENLEGFGVPHFEAIAGIETLEKLIVDVRRASVPEAELAAFREARPKVEVDVRGPKG